VDEHGVKVERKGCADKRVTEEMARAAESATARTKAGLSDPKAERMAREIRRPIEEHVNEFIAFLQAQGDSPGHVAGTRSLIDLTLTLAGIERIAELTPSAVSRAMAVLKRDNLSARTINGYLVAVKSFSRWLKRDGRIPDYELEPMKKLNEKVDRRRVRRVLTPEEATRVIQAALDGPRFRKLTGEDRAVLYLVAAGTGFRRKELRSLTPESFALDADPSTITVKAAYSKHRRDDIQPIAGSLADRLHPWLARKASRRPVFEGMTNRTAEMLRVDLEAAGVTYETSEGVVDFHSLRNAYITNLVASGASVKTCQTLARHSTPTLTIGLYARTSLHDVQGAVESLPDLTPKAPESLALTGTDTTPINDRFAHHLPTGGDGPVRPETVTDVIRGSTVQESMEGKSRENKAQDGPVRPQTAPDGSRPVRANSEPAPSSSRVPSPVGLPFR
jgi:integrase